jgi:hypothetical protein
MYKGNGALDSDKKESVAGAKQVSNLVPTKGLQFLKSKVFFQSPFGYFHHTLEMIR